MDTQSPDLQNDLQVPSETIQPEKASNYNYPDNLPNENNLKHIKNSKYPNVAFNWIPEKNQSKYIDFPKTVFEKFSRFLNSNGTKNSLGCITI